MIAEFVRCCDKFAGSVHPLGIAQCRDPIFEGAQGLLLDQDNKQFFPHLTRSHTGMRNVRILCEQAGIGGVDVYYVSRTYLTRHGAGPLPGEDRGLSFEDNTNVEHSFQGKIRFAPLITYDLGRRCAQDAGGPFKLVLTHCDQRIPSCKADLYFNGPTRDCAYTVPGKKELLAC
jgi:adenylosuccinate synthase